MRLKFEERLTDAGPVIHASVGPALGDENLADWVEANLVVDTGAAMTLISREVLGLLNLKKIDERRTYGVGGASGVEPPKRPVYRVTLAFGDPVVFLTLPVREIDPPAVRYYQGFLGRDALSRGILRYDGPAGKATLDFPEGETVLQYPR